MTGINVAWSALGGAPELVARVVDEVRRDVLDARLPVRETARACVAGCALAAAELGARRTGAAEVPAVRVDDGAVATAFVSERHLRVDGRASAGFAPLSRFWRTADGWVRTHANYPHHRERLLTALEVTGGGGPGAGDVDAGAMDARERAVRERAVRERAVRYEVDAVAAALAERTSVEAEDAVYAAGGLAVALRTPEEWAAHPQGAEVRRLPLVERGTLDAPPGRPLTPLRPFAPLAPVSPLTPRTGAAGPLLPAAGLRVLDLTRVIAGPVATRTLALLGADVLRVDAPHLPELPVQHLDTGFGKRSTRLDLAVDGRTFEELLGSADVVVTGYRPGALDRFGLSPEALAERRPGVVVAQLSAWGAHGPWRERRGFDSLVQVATGIAVAEGSAERPGALPAQALDHGTGYLLAAAVLRALTERADDGASRYVRLSLARTAEWLLHEVPRDREVPRAGEGDRRGNGDVDVDRSAVPGGPYGSPDPWLTERDSPCGRLRYALPPLSFANGPKDWAGPPTRWGTDPARWR
ncbi:hypothetical protein ELQ87_30450 [Streptomyces griseoviridis]|uniref:CoA transferase n=1 Tax=Streptomyces griseoviridis TaxID=45398 RepID=A0A3Q9KZH0_STRGD|nr:CoA transferase [Streptomyces griseoviridis]AZS88075.1 hypothetical protein ELQ87_30450 [Streptomyces griseoviridis]QCN85079.1 hypothetical protein DDJ31_08815 [Streptomyces griseoviridis]